MTRLHFSLLPALSAVPLLLLAACSAPHIAPPVQAVSKVRVIEEEAPPVVQTPPSGDSFSQPEKVLVEHLKLDLTVDFQQKKLTGRASLRIANKAGTDRLILDTRDLDVRTVTLDDGRATRFTIGEEVPYHGRPMEIEITPETRWVHVDYSTHPDGAALQVTRAVHAPPPVPAYDEAGRPLRAARWQRRRRHFRRRRRGRDGRHAARRSHARVHARDRQPLRQSPQPRRGRRPAGRCLRIPDQVFCRLRRQESG